MRNGRPVRLRFGTCILSPARLRLRRHGRAVCSLVNLVSRPMGFFAFRQGKPTSIVCMDGLDLYLLLEQGLELVEVLDQNAEGGRDWCGFRCLERPLSGSLNGYSDSVPHHLARVLILAQAFERGVPKQAVVIQPRYSTSATSSGATKTLLCARDLETAQVRW
jgi:hypothetical protein